MRTTLAPKPPTSQIKRALAQPRKAETASFTDAQREALRAAAQSFKIWWQAPPASSGEGVRFDNLASSVELVFKLFRE